MAEAPRPQSGAPAALRTYLELASGLGDASRKQVRKVVKELIGKGNATADQVKAMTADLLTANTANREALGRLVKSEVDRALGRVGLATLDEVNELTTRVRDLERQLRDARKAAVAPEGAPAADAAPTEKAAQKAADKGRKAGKKADKPAVPAEPPAPRKAVATKAVRKVTAPAAGGVPGSATTTVRKATRRAVPADQAVVARRSVRAGRPGHALQEGQR